MILSTCEKRKLYVTNSDFLIDLWLLDVVYVFHRFSVSSRVVWDACPSLHDQLHGIEVIPLYFKIRYPAVALVVFRPWCLKITFDITSRGTPFLLAYVAEYLRSDLSP